VRYPQTLRVRLAAATAVSILAAVVVFAIVTVIVVGHELRGSLDTALRQRAQEVAELAVTAPSVLRDPGAFESPDSGRQLAVEVIDSRGRILARSLTLGSEILPEDSIVGQALRHGRTGVLDITLNGRPFRMYAAPIAAAGGPASGGPPPPSEPPLRPPPPGPPRPPSSSPTEPPAPGVPAGGVGVPTSLRTRYCWPIVQKLVVIQ